MVPLVPGNSFPESCAGLFSVKKAAEDRFHASQGPNPESLQEVWI
jgi:hypothetical protein